MTAPSLEEQIIQLQDAIASLEARRATWGGAAADTAIAALREKLDALRREPVAGQRKLVTVLFSDLVGFTPMAEHLDPEDVREVLECYFEPWRKAIGQFGGRLEKFIGDAVMAVFGVPVATETDAEKAIRAALVVREGLHQLNTTLEQRFGIRLAMRVGIHTGTVLAAEVGGGGDLAVTGDTVNLASRLEGQAPPGGILISHDTYRHVRGAFDVQVVGPVTVKGRSEPVQTYLVGGARPRAFHRGLRGVEGVETRMVGREAELGQLQAALRSVVDDGRHLAVTVIGEAGVGKSRLLFEFENWADVLPQRFFLFKGRASYGRQSLPYSLVRDLLAFRFQIQDSDPPEQVRVKLEEGFAQVLGAGLQSEMQAHFVGQLLGLSFGDSPHLREAQGDARQIRDRALVYLSDYLCGVTERLPAVILLEDLHWADDSSLNLLDSLSLSLADRPLLIVGLARPSLLQRRPDWGAERAFQRRIELECLSEQEARRLVEEILRRAEPVPEALRDLITGKTEGNPFYVEELIKMLIEDGVIIPGSEAWRVELARLGAVPVPPTLAGVLQARLDRLAAEERTVLQQASVVGRRFWDGAVERLGEAEGAGSEGLPRPGRVAVARTLAAIQAREMVFRQATSAFDGTEEYLFKHALLREVAYEGVLRRVRRVYHALAAEWLEEQGGERAGEHAGLIADHLEAAGETQRALPYLRRAGEQAAARFANAEAVAYLSRALALSPGEDLPGRYDLLLDREGAYDLVGDRAAQAADLAELQALAEALDDRRRQAETALRQARYALETGDYAASAVAAQNAIRLAGKSADALVEVEGHLLWGQALWRQSEFQASQALLEKAVGLARAARLPLEQALGLRHLGSVCWCLGDYAQAAAYYDQSLAFCRQLGDRRSECAALNNLGLVYWRLGDWNRAQEHLVQAQRIRRDIGDLPGVASSLTNLTGLASDRGELAEAQVYGEQALSIVRQIANPALEALVLGSLGQIARARGRYALARDYGEQDLRIVRSIGDKRLEGAALDNLSGYCRAQGEFGLAQEYIRQALALTQVMGDRQSGAACLLDFGELLRDLGDYGAARERCEEALAINRDIGDRGREAEGLNQLALLCHHMHDDSSALATSELARRMHQESGRRTLLAHALTCQGHALAGLGRMDEAVAAYERALEIRRDLGQPHLAAEVSAGLARLALAQGDLPQAQARVEQILDHLEAGTLYGTDEPVRIYLTCYQVLRAAQDPRARGMLRTAYALLQGRAARIADAEQRRTFLENVRAHCELAREFALVQQGSQPEDLPASRPAPSSSASEG